MLKRFIKRDLPGAILLGLIVINLAACGNLFLDDQDLVLQAKEYLEQRKIKAAAIELRNALQKNRDNAEARYLLGSITLDIGDFATAEKEFRRAREAGWEEEAAVTGLARALLGQQRYTRVLEDIEIKDSYTSSGRASLLGLRAAAAVGLGNSDQARAMIDRGTALDPKAVDVMKVSIQLQYLAGRTEEARDTLAQALRDHPKNPDLLLISAGLAVQDKDSDTAAKAYQQVIDADPHGYMTLNGRNARLGLAMLQILAEELDPAEATLKPLLKSNPRDPQTNYLGGLLAMRKGNLELAEEHLFKVLKFAPSHNATILLLGTVNFDQKDFEQAAYFLSKYLGAVPDNAAARKLLGRSYILLGKHDSALASLKPGLQDNADDAELLALASLSEIKKGDTIAGISGLERAVTIDPDSIALRRELAKAYLATGEADLAVKELKTILAGEGENKQNEILLVLAHLRAGELDQAISFVLDMLKRSPDDPATLTLAGNVFAASKNHGEARKYYSRALAENSVFPSAIMSLALIEELDGNIGQAAELYRKLVDSDFKSVLPMLGLARIADQQGAKQEMLTWLKRAHESDQGNLKTVTLLAGYYLDQNDIVKAAVLVRDALEASPDAAVLLALQGRILMKENKYKQALNPLTKLVAARPESVEARVLIGECFLQLGQLSDARRELAYAQEKAPGNVQVLALMSKLAIKEGDFESALQYSREIENNFPEQYFGYALSGDVLMASRDHAAADRAYNKALERAQISVVAIRRAENAAQSGDPDKAIAYLREWLEEYPEDSKAMLSLGIGLQTMGNNSGAISAYEKALESDPENPVALNNLALLYSLAGRPDALGFAERAWIAAPDSAGILDTYGWLLVENGQISKGLQLLEKAIKSLPGNPDVRYHHAVAVYRAGNKKDARQRLQALLNEGVSFEGREDAERLLME